MDAVKSQLSKYVKCTRNAAESQSATIYTCK